MEYLTNFLKDSDKNPPYQTYLIGLCFTVGFIKIARLSMGALAFIYRHTLKRQANFIAKYYLTDTWAVVTGGSDGIGEQICRDLGRQGFNICIIARNKSKIDLKLADIKAEVKRMTGKDIKTRGVVADLG